MRNDEVFEFACKIIRETPNAILVHDDVTDEDIWFPLSTVEEIHRDPNGYGTIVVKAWIARQKGLYK